MTANTVQSAPPPRDRLQEQFWEVQSAEGHALEVRNAAEGAVEDARLALNHADIALRRARVEVDEFLLAHPECEFRVFRPEDIDEASSLDIRPLFPDTAKNVA